MITTDILRRLCPSSKQAIIDGVVLYFNKYADEYEISNELRVCHFLAQAAHESAHFMTLEEYASGDAYEGRSDLGNTQPGDGRRYQGRGIFQLTGRANYVAYGNKLSVDLVNDPPLAATPEISVLTAMEYWRSKGLNAFADANDIMSITRRINGGTNGLDDRRSYLTKIQRLLKDPEAMYIGDKNAAVREAQNLLIQHGYKIGSDGDFGPGTEQAVKQYQKSNNLVATGIIDQITLNKLRSS